MFSSLTRSGLALVGSHVGRSRTEGPSLVSLMNPRFAPDLAAIAFANFGFIGDTGITYRQVMALVQRLPHDTGHK